MAKGSANEREISKEISLWWTNNTRSDCVWRTAGSGARATVRSKKKKKTAYQSGDLTFIDPIIKPLFDLILFEVKVGYNKDIDTLSFVDNLLAGKDPILLRWWSKAEDERKHADRKFCVIIFKRDRHGKCIMLSSEFFVYLEALNGVYIHPVLTVNPSIGQTLIIISFDQFRRWCPPESIFMLCNKLGIECKLPERVKKPKLLRR